MTVTLVPWVSLQTMDELVEGEERTFRIGFLTVPVGRAACARKAGVRSRRQRVNTIVSAASACLFLLEFSTFIAKFLPCVFCIIQLWRPPKGSRASLFSLSDFFYTIQYNRRAYKKQENRASIKKIIKNSVPWERETLLVSQSSASVSPEISESITRE